MLKGSPNVGVATTWQGLFGLIYFLQKDSQEDLAKEERRNKIRFEKIVG